MRRTDKQPAIVLGLLVMAAASAACAQQTSSGEADSPPAAETIGVEEAAADIEAAEEQPDADQALPTPPPEKDAACLDCHTDEERLKSLATEAEPAEAPSSGEG